MKATNAHQYPYYTTHRRTPSRYPNSSEILDIRNKIIDSLLAAAITFGVVAILFFLLIL